MGRTVGACGSRESHSHPLGNAHARQPADISRIPDGREMRRDDIETNTWNAKVLTVAPHSDHQLVISHRIVLPGYRPVFPFDLLADFEVVLEIWNGRDGWFDFDLLFVKV